MSLGSLDSLSSAGDQQFLVLLVSFGMLLDVALLGRLGTPALDGELVAGPVRGPSLLESGHSTHEGPGLCRASTSRASLTAVGSAYPPVGVGAERRPPPPSLHRISPTLAFAVLGQARADGHLHPEDESRRSVPTADAFRRRHRRIPSGSGSCLLPLLLGAENVMSDLPFTALPLAGHTRPRSPSPTRASDEGTACGGSTEGQRGLLLVDEPAAGPHRRSR